MQQRGWVQATPTAQRSGRRWSGHGVVETRGEVIYEETIKRLVAFGAIRVRDATRVEIVVS